MYISLMGRSLNLALLAFAVANPVLAATDERGFIEEIVVTATHRETNLMETPQAISAVSAEQIDQLGATSMEGLYRNVTGLNMSEGAQAGGNRYTIRGVSSQTGTASYAQTFAAVSVYLDDIPMTSAQGPAQQFGGNLFDIERVEILKGPQGTLYGEGSVGGTIRFIQKKPDLEGTDWKVKGSMHSTDDSDDLSHRVDAMVNVPLSETIALRLNAYTVERAGWIDKTDTGEDDVNSNTSQGFRLAGLWAVNNRLTLEGAYYLSENETEGSVVAQRRFEENLNARIPGRPPFADEDIEILSLNLDYEFDWATLQLAYSNMDRERLSETETPLGVAAAFDSFIQTNVYFRAADNPTEFPTLLGEGWIFNPDYVTVNNQLAFNVNDLSSSDRDTFEAKLLSNADGALRWTTGLFWKDSNDIRSSNQPYLLIPSLTDAPAVNALYTEFYNDPSNDHVDTLDEISVFGEATYAFSDTLELTIGGRWTDLEQTLEDSLAETSDQVFSPKIGISWFPREELLTYFNITTGFRPGNVNLGQEFNARQLVGSGDNVIPETPFAPNPDMLTGNQAAAIATSRISYEGDSVVNYELGLKTRLLDNRWNLTASIYYFDWEDTILTFQQDNLPTINRAYNDNAGAAHTQGVEIDLVGNLTDQLRIRLGGDFNEAELDEAVGSIPSGSQLPNVPEWSWHATVDYMLSLDNNLTLNFMVNHTVMAEQVTTLALAPVVIPRRQQTDLKISLSGASERWNASLFATNVLNEDEVVFDCSGFGNPICEGFQAPRTVGLEITFRRQ